MEESLKTPMIWVYIDGPKSGYGRFYNMSTTPTPRGKYGKCQASHASIVSCRMRQWNISSSLVRKYITNKFNSKLKQ